MPHPFHPDDFPINKEVVLKPTKTYYLKGCVHFKTNAEVLDLTGKIRQRFNNFSKEFLDEAGEAARQAGGPAFSISSSGNMMRTIKTLTDAGSGEPLCDLNITFVSFGSSTVRFPSGSQHSRHEIELCPVGDGWEPQRHEAFVKNSIPYFWDMSDGRVGVLYKCLNQQRVEIARVAGYGFDQDAVLVLNANELDEVVAVSTCIILINGRDAMDA
ncbi:Uu.00g045890.m01.CDS01 [Anthostomella pinea]|uniref:Uu.00g045890.m01.CDS01 n=1 Tax=Anthostomella pinea TaxID=933095 RepID=A0AAI8YEC9_9PEZI|nr:Uu.00g045890.m01.CDS01 [Anthostomella pinea]